MASQTVENYLKALYNLGDDKGEVNISELSAHLGVSKPTAHSMVKNLFDEGLVHYQKYKPLKLTDKGEKVGALVIRKHRLTEMYLVDKMGFGWDEVHDIAEQIEHINSPLFFDRMDELMDFPQFDPHGSPIPDKDGNVIKNEYLALNQCQVGDVVQLKTLSHSSKDFLNFLDKHDISLGQIMEIISVEVFDKSVIVSYDKHPNELLSQKVCERLLVLKI